MNSPTRHTPLPQPPDIAMLLQLLALASGAALAAAEVLSLSELTWTLQNAEGKINVPAQQPSQVHLDLKNADVITEPLLGINGM